MKYEAVYLHNRAGEFVGVAIHKVGTQKLHDTNIWTESQSNVEEFRATLERLNDENVLRQFWPNAMDPEVVELVENPDWEPLTLKKEAVIDYDASTIVFIKQPRWGWEFDSNAGAQIGFDDEKAEPIYEGAVVPKANPDTGEVEWYDTEEVDTDASRFVRKFANAPDPIEVQNRYFKAQETVARARALAASA